MTTAERIEGTMIDAEGSIRTSISEYNTKDARPQEFDLEIESTSWTTFAVVLQSIDLLAVIAGALFTGAFIYLFTILSMTSHTSIRETISAALTHHHRHTMACGSQDTKPPVLKKSSLMTPTYEEVISEPYVADQIQDEEDHSDHDHE